MVPKGVGPTGGRGLKYSTGIQCWQLRVGINPLVATALRAKPV